MFVLLAFQLSTCGSASAQPVQSEQRDGTREIRLTGPLAVEPDGVAGPLRGDDF